MTRSLVIALTLLAFSSVTGCSFSVPGDTLVPTCSPIGDGTLSTFNTDGSFRVTSKGVLQNGDMAVVACNGSQAIEVFVTGLKAGTERNHQPDVFVDDRNNVVYADDLVVTSLKPVTPKNLTGVTVQCSPRTPGCDAPTAAATDPGTSATTGS